MHISVISSPAEQTAGGSAAFSTVTALGFFDGVHEGHRRLFEETCRQAKRLCALPAVFTFAENGGTYKAGAPRLTEWEEKLELFRQAGFAYVFCADFDELKQCSPEEFATEVLVGQCRAQMAVCGFNFRFGKGAAADADVLRRLLLPCGCEVMKVEPYLYEGKPVSSTLIRSALEAGDVEGAARMLGRPFGIRFPVLHGKMLGREIGVPTINQTFPAGFAVPRPGVYHCECTVDGVDYPAVSNVGFRPTVEDAGRINCETHIIGFEGWLYGKRVPVRFIRRLRDERRFDSLEELVGAIMSNIEEVKRYYEQRG